MLSTRLFLSTHIPQRRLLHSSSSLFATSTKGQAPQTSRIHTSARLYKESEPKHSADSYVKEVDTSPPDNTKTHRVDEENGQIQRPFEAHKAYENVSKETPFEPQVEKKEEKDHRLGYGGTKKDSEKNTSEPGEGPEGKSAGGRQ